MLKDGTPVAVKVQKPSIRDQMPWDLLCYRIMVYAFDYLFELPMYWTGKDVSKYGVGQRCCMETP